jgi:dual specificity tyrosine-phosphorylation-regulated kinase 2/3/4
MEILGSGAFTVVQRGEFNGTPCAVKFLDNRENNRKYCRKEVEILKRLKDTKHSVKMLDYKISRNGGFIKYELLDKTLDDVLDEWYVEQTHSGMSKNAKRNSKNRIEKINRQLKTALEEIHSRGVVHTDLKPDNIMFDFQGNLKLIDFGNAVWLEELNAGKNSIGITQYRPPEYIIRSPLDEQVDWWAYGCLVFEILTGKALFSSHYENEMSKNACLLGQIILLIGNFKSKFLVSGSKTYKYFDVENNYKYLYSYLLGKRVNILDVLKDNNVANPEYWAEYILHFLQR